MDWHKDFQESQLEAIQKFYHQLQQRSPEKVSLKDAVILWFTSEHAEKFRQSYLKNHAVPTHP